MVILYLLAWTGDRDSWQGLIVVQVNDGLADLTSATAKRLEWRSKLVLAGPLSLDGQVAPCQS